MGTSFRLMTPAGLFRGLGVVKGAAVRVNAAGFGWLLDDLVGAGEQCRRYFNPNRLSCLPVDPKTEFGWLLNRDVGRLMPSQYLIDQGSEAVINLVYIGTVRHKQAGRDAKRVIAICQQALLHGKCSNLLAVTNS